MLEIILEEMEFYAFHGMYPEEKKLGNKFTVHLRVAIKNPSSLVDYSQLYQLVAQEMNSNAVSTLEELSQKICNCIKSHYPQIYRITIEVRKHLPPINGICKYAAIRRIQQY
ncbi:MAG: dihydroneopterin aldolase [Bacteroidia bacterium]|nr:dihydroneopterin aldolase [Bacteroidia bacterium]MDW8159536.1 dihydroneopterin aldolase [Bacteroidia bacterium]